MAILLESVTDRVVTGGVPTILVMDADTDLMDGVCALEVEDNF